MFARRLTVVFVCALAVTACERKLPDAEVAARVNGVAITKKEFESTVERNMARYRGQGHQLQPNIEQRIRESVLRRMIDDKMIELKAKELAVDVAKEELDAKFAEHKARFRTEQAFADYLKRSQNTEEVMKEDLRRNLLRDRVVEKMSGSVDVTDEELQKYYDENIQRFKDREQVKLSRILVRTAPNMSDADKKAALAKAKKLAVEAKKPDADFAKLAREASAGTEASAEGEMNWMNRGRLPPELDSVAFTLAPGAVSDAIETNRGYEILKVWEKKEERVKPLDEVKETIRTSLVARKRNEKRRDVLRQLKTEAKVEQLMTFETAAPAGGPAAGGPAGSAPQGMANPAEQHLRMPRVPTEPPERIKAMGIPGAQPDAQPAPAPDAAPQQPQH